MYVIENLPQGVSDPYSTSGFQKMMHFCRKNVRSTERPENSGLAPMLLSNTVCFRVAPYLGSP